MKGAAQKTETADLLPLLDMFAGTPMLVLGDLILDHYVWGEVSRISPEAPVVVVRVQKEDRRLGGAANVANNLVSLGAQVACSGIIGDDDEGRRVRQLCDAAGIDHSGVISVADRPTSIKSRIVARAQQVVRVDRESTEELPSTCERKICEWLNTRLDGFAGVVISDYAKGFLSSGVFDAIRRVKEAEQGQLSKPLLIDPKQANFDLYSYATVVKPNRAEAAEASGMQISNRADAVHAARRLIERWNAEMVLVTLGEMGMVLVFRDEQVPAVEIDTEAKQVFDVSGAGDTVSAVFSLTLAVGGTPSQAARLANIAAGLVVAEVGAVAVDMDRLRSVLQAGGVG